MGRANAGMDDPLLGLRSSTLNSIKLHLILGGIVILMSLPEGRPRWPGWPPGWRRHLALSWGLLLALWPLMAYVLWRIAAHTRRAIVGFGLVGLQVCIVAGDLGLLSVLACVSARMRVPTLWLALAGTFAGIMALAVYMESKVMPTLWRRSIECGRIDLERGLYDPRIRLTPERVGGSSRLVGAVLMAFGPLAGLALSKMLGYTTGGNVQWLVGAGLGFVALLLVLIATWPGAFSMLVRVIIWERKSGKRLRIAAR